MLGCIKGMFSGMHGTWLASCHGCLPQIWVRGGLPLRRLIFCLAGLGLGLGLGLGKPVLLGLRKPVWLRLREEIAEL